MNHKPYIDEGRRVWLPINEHRYLQRYNGGFTCFGNTKGVGAYDSTHFHTLDMLEHDMLKYTHQSKIAVAQLYYMAVSSVLQRYYEDLQPASDIPEIIRKYLYTYFYNDFDARGLRSITEFEIPKIVQSPDAEHNDVQFYIVADIATCEIAAGFSVDEQGIITMTVYQDNCMRNYFMQLPKLQYLPYMQSTITNTVAYYVDNEVLQQAIQYMLLSAGFNAYMDYINITIKDESISYIPDELCKNAPVCLNLNTLADYIPFDSFEFKEEEI